MGNRIHLILRKIFLSKSLIRMSRWLGESELCRHARGPCVRMLLPWAVGVSTLPKWLPNYESLTL